MVDLEKQAQRLTELVTRGVRDKFGETKEYAQVARYGDPPSTIYASDFREHICRHTMLKKFDAISSTKF
jgi:hypothetical protein